MIENPLVVVGLIAATLGLIFWTASGPTPFWRKFYSFVPALLLCYFIPALYNTFGLVDGGNTPLYAPISRDALLPAALVLLTLSVDFKGLVRLGPKMIAMLFAGTAGVMLGAVVSFLVMGVIHPETVAGDTWSGMAALAGSWIGGGANMVAMREVFEVDAGLFGSFAVVDIAVGMLWMATLLFLASRAEAIDRRTGADTSAIDELKVRIAAFHAEHGRVTTLTDMMIMVGLAFGCVGIAHMVAGPIADWFDSFELGRSLNLNSSFLWLVLSTTTAGLLLSFTRARRLEGAGASALGSVMLYFLIASIGLQMDLRALVEVPMLLVLGLIWMAVHVVVLLVAAKLLKAPLFYIAVGSQANIGAAASAPVVAAAFHPNLAPVGVIMGSIGYATGTYCAYLVGITLRALAGG